jgi:hypothetical protein
LPEQSSSVIKALHELIDRANRAGTVIYTMHGRGLASPGVDDTGSSQPPGAQEGATALGDGLLRHTSAVVEETLNRQQQGLASIAQLTGGLAYENGNDLGFGLQRVLDDQRGYYLLGFSPEPGIFTGKRAERRYHQIAVRVTKPGLHVRSRTGFFGETDEDATPRPKTPLEQMRTAMLSPFHSSAIHVRLTPLYAEVRKIGAVVRNLLHVDVRDLRFTTEIDGSASAHIKVFLVAASSGDHPLASEWRDFTLRVPPGAMENSLRDGGAFKMDVVVPNAGPYQIRAAVRDEATAKVGSASQYIEIPDMKKVHWALTSVLLATAAGDAPANGPRAITVARRQFHKGSEIEYFCLLEASKKLKESDLKGLDVTVRLMREGKEVYSGPAKLAEMVDGHRVVGGSLRLGASIVPGDYVLGVIAMDNPRKPKDVAAQWTDFEVVE